MSGENKIKGLSDQDVKKRIAEGLINVDNSLKTRKISDIIKNNVCTLFNLVNIILAILVIFTMQWKNLLFICVIVVNVFIGIIQEIRSKRSTDKLAIVTSSKIEVLRDDKIEKIDHCDIVLDDIIVLKRGNQVPADCKILSGSCQANESLLTGESDLIGKCEGDELMSGSFINSGTIYAKVIHVGTDNYSAKITREAKSSSKINSEIMKSLNAIIKYVSILLIPVGIMLFCKSYFITNTGFNESILSSVSAMVGMIPEGLILLTSTVLAVSVIRLSRQNVLVQQLYCIETLARVDTLCLDKTGTLTTGNMKVEKVVSFDRTYDEKIKEAFVSLINADKDKNETAKSIEDYYKNKGITKIYEPSAVIPFSSETKWSGATFTNGESYVMGAAQFVLSKYPKVYDQIKDLINENSKTSRVLLLSKVEGFKEDNFQNFAPEMIGTPLPMALVCITDEIRSTAHSTIEFFKNQGVDIKIISGDDPVTVSGIAKQVGVDGAENYIDASNIENEEQIEIALKEKSVFGRVKPEQKKQFVEFLQKNHKTVAMTGDGVNDVLALKAADCSIAMNSGSDATRNISHIVLVDNDFSKMPEVVAEGRRSINNLQRSGSLFLVKTIMSLVLGTLFVFLPYDYPFTPIQMTLFSSICIGIPSFVLALEPNQDIVTGHFLANCIFRSLPGGLCAILSILAINVIGYEIFNLSYNEVASLSLLALCFLGLMLIVRLSIPYTLLRVCLTFFVIAGLIGGSIVMPNIFDIAPLNQSMIILLLSICGINLIIYNLLYNRLQRRQNIMIEREKCGEYDKLAYVFKKFF